jgi:hypothetical protein
MNKLMMIALAVSTLGLAACANNGDNARVDQAPYGYDRTVGAQPKAAPMHHSDTVFHSKQSK